jgi:hypothetical protein
MNKIDDLKKKISDAMDAVECHQDVEIVDDPVRRGHVFLHKGKEFLFLSLIEESYLPEEIRSQLKNRDKIWCERKHGTEGDYDPHECDNQLCILLPEWAF